MRALIGRAIARNVLAIGLPLAAILVAGQVSDPELSGPTPAESALADILASNDCWQGAQPDDVDFPSAVVLTHEGETIPVLSTDVGPALDFLFEGADNGIETVHAFCR